MAEPTWEGGCLCGRVRYRASGAARKPHYCHCRMCQRGVGAPVTAWVNLPLAGFSFTGAEPAYFRSSPELRRGFCAACGSSICTIADGDDVVCVTLASLDDPTRIAPALHMWTDSRMPWLEIADDLPRHAGQA